MPKFALFDLDLDEISLCPDGDNPPARVVLAKASSKTMPDLERKKGNKDNWVEAAGGLPSFIERIAKHLHYEQGMSISHAIAAAVNQCKKWAAGGGNVKPETVAKAAKAIAEWEAKKVKAKVKKETEPSEPVEDMPDPVEEREDEFLDEDADDEEEVEKKKNPGMNKPHEYSNEDKEKHGETKCDQCGQAPDSPMHKVARKRKLKKAVLDLLGLSDLDEDDNESEGGEVADKDTKIKKDDLPAEVVEYIEALEGKVEELEAAEEDPIEKNDDKDVLEKADPAVRALIEKAQADAATAIKKADEERDLRLTREFIEKAGTLPNVNANKEELAELLKGLAEKAPEEAAKLEPILKALNEQIAKSKLFSSLGVGGADTTIAKSVESAAEELRKADPNLTMEQAMVKVYETRPDLYDEQLQEV